MPLLLGKKDPVYNKKTLQYAHYRIAQNLPIIPAQFGHETLISANGWGMNGNGPDDSVAPGFQGAGDCVFAGGAHETDLWNVEGQHPIAIDGKCSISDYSAVTGYVIGDDSTDQGTDVQTALQYRQNTGLIDTSGVRHKIGAYLALEPGNTQHLYEALYLFSAVGIGVQFPESAMDQFNAGKPWTVVSGASVDGGHYVPLVALRSNIVCVTWAQLQQMTLQFYQKYCDEAYAILSPEFLASGESPEGFNLPALQADMQAL
jgi:hypothetical protein